MNISHSFKVRTDDSLFISVFNIHNTEVAKANKCFKIIYGRKKYKKLQSLIREKKGLMGIFDVDPTDELVTYALLMTQAQNQRRK